MPPRAPPILKRKGNEMLRSPLGFAIVLVVGSAHAAEDPFLSVDHLGDCYGVPTRAGTTRRLDGGKAYALEAYGSEYGHHCQQDQGRFVYQEMEGDFDVHAQVAALTNDTGQPAKACLMVREEADDPRSRFAAIMALADVPFGRRHDGAFPNSFTFDVRPIVGGNLKNKGFRYAGPPIKERRRFPHVWLRLKRKGDRVTAFVGKDGKRWEEIPPENPRIGLPSLPLGRRVAVGMCLSSTPEEKPEVRAQARFAHLTGFRKGPPLLAGAREADTALATTLPPLPAPPEGRKRLALGRPLPMAEAPLTATDGRAFTLARAGGPRGTLVLFTAPGCAEAGAAEARAVSLAERFARKGIGAVIVQASPAAMGGKPTPGLYRVTDTTGALAGAFGARAAPDVFLFGASGKLVYVGRAEDSRPRRAYLEQGLRELAKGGWPSVGETGPAGCALGRR